MIKQKVLILSILLLNGWNLISQTCCSGGVPVSSNIGFQSGPAKVIQISLSADFNKLTSLFVESQKLDDELRKRTTQSYFLRVAYSFLPSLTAEAFFPFIKQTRKIYRIDGKQSDFDSTFGVGDPVLLLIYNLTERPVTWRFGVGPQFPLGSFTKTNDDGLFLVEDLQPGSGAWDFVLFSSLEYSLPFRPSTLIYINSIFSLNGTNNESRGGSQQYGFGNDIQLLAGIGDQWILGTQPINYGLAARYRFAKRDKINSIPTTGTGGEWIFLKFSLGTQIVSESSLTINYEFPVYSYVNETQLSPDSFINLSFYKAISTSRKNTFNQFIN